MMARTKVSLRRQLLLILTSPSHSPAHVLIVSPFHSVPPSPPPPPKKRPSTTSTSCLPSIRPPPLILSLLLLRFLPSVFYRLSPVRFSCWDISQLTVVTATAGRLRAPSKRARCACGLIKRPFVQVYVTASFRNVSSNLWVAKLQPPELLSVSTPALRSVEVDVEATLPQSNRDAATVTNAAQVLWKEAPRGCARTRASTVLEMMTLEL